MIELFKSGILQYLRENKRDLIIKGDSYNSFDGSLLNEKEKDDCLNIIGAMLESQICVYYIGKIMNFVKIFESQIKFKKYGRIQTIHILVMNSIILLYNKAPAIRCIIN